MDCTQAGSLCYIVLRSVRRSASGKYKSLAFAPASAGGHHLGSGTTRERIGDEFMVDGRVQATTAVRTFRRSISMQALVYNGPRNVRIKNVPDSKIERPTDVLVKITTTNICGSDLHMYEGRTDMESGRVLGHENLGQVIEIGEAIDRVKVGDWVCLPFNIACGFCKNCERGLTGFCLTTNPGNAGAAYGFAGMGPYSGGQAEYLRVPYGDFNCLVLPPMPKRSKTTT